MEAVEALARPGQWMSVLPRSLVKQVAGQIEQAREVWYKDREEGLPGVYLPNALARKFRKAAETFEWSRKKLRFTRSAGAAFVCDAFVRRRHGLADDPGDSRP